MRVRFVRTAQARIDAAGDAEASIGCPSGVTWEVTSTTVSSTSALRTTANIYLGSVSPSGLLEGTWSGNRDTSDTPHTMLGGERIVCQWSGGTPNSLATLRIAGFQE